MADTSDQAIKASKEIEERRTKRKKKKEKENEKELDVIEIRLIAIHDPKGKLGPNEPLSAAIEAVNKLDDTFVLTNVAQTTLFKVDLPNKLGDRSH